MNRKWIVLVLLTLGANYACAASFDCDKAGTKVEKMICADSELSKLDEELGKAYSKARDVSSEPDRLKQQQKDWIKERNKCVDSQCLSQRYEARIAELGKVMVSSNAKENAPAVDAERKYPPYPDVWGYELPMSENGNRNANYATFMNPAGALQVMYVTRGSGQGGYDFSLLDFFSGGIKHFSSDKELERFSKENRGYRINSISHNVAKFGDGATVAREGFSHNCYINLPFRLVVKDKDGVVLVNKYLLYLREMPRVQSVTPYCENAQGESSFNVHVESVFGSIIMLKDDTFILSESGGNLVLRMDEQLETKYKNKHLYVVGAEVVDGIKQRLLEEGKFNHQSFDDAVVAYLKGLNKGEI